MTTSYLSTAQTISRFWDFPSFQISKLILAMLRHQLIYFHSNDFKSSMFKCKAFHHIFDRFVMQMGKDELVILWIFRFVLTALVQDLLGGFFRPILAKFSQFKWSTKTIPEIFGTFMTKMRCFMRSSCYSSFFLSCRRVKSTIMRSNATLRKMAATEAPLNWPNLNNLIKRAYYILKS